VISLTSFVETLATMYVEGVWKIALLFTLIGIALIVISYAKVWTRRQSDRKFESGVGLFTIGLTAHLIYLYSIGYLVIALLLIALLIAFSIYWYKMRSSESGTVSHQESNIKPIDTTNQCSKCGGFLVQRTNRKTGQHFIGCEHYPQCKYTTTI
jgi:hypothetical protein